MTASELSVVPLRDQKTCAQPRSNASLPLCWTPDESLSLALSPWPHRLQHRSHRGGDPSSASYDLKHQRDAVRIQFASKVRAQLVRQQRGSVCQRRLDIVEGLPFAPSHLP